MDFPLLNKTLKYDSGSGSQSPSVQLAADLAQEVLAPVAAALDLEHTFPKEPLTRLAQEGFLGIAIPKEDGGLGCSYQDFSQIMIELTRGCASTSIAISVSNMVGVLLHEHASPAVQKIFIDHLKSRDLRLLSFAITEPNSGSDAQSIQTTYEEDGDSWLIHGDKCFITSGSHAAGFVTTARRKDNPSEISMIFIPNPSQGLSISADENKMGLSASSTVQLFFEGVRVPKDYLLGKPGAGFSIAMHALNAGRISVAAQGLGIALATIHEVKRWLDQNEHNSASKRTRFADFVTQFEAGMQLIAYAAQSLDQKKLRPEQASMAKVYCTELANEIAQRSLDLVGFEAFLNANPIERHLRDSRVTTLYEGTSEIQRLIIAKNLVKNGRAA